MGIKTIILDNLAWAISGFFTVLGVLGKMYYDIRGNKQRAEANEEQIKELQDSHDEFKSMASNIQVIKNDIGWMKEQIQKNSK